MTRSHALGARPMNISLEIRRNHLGRREIAGEPEPFRRHGSPASWLLPKRISTELRHHPREGAASAAKGGPK
jgi:hypothetical protein